MTKENSVQRFRKIMDESKKPAESGEGGIAGNPVSQEILNLDSERAQDFETPQITSASDIEVAHRSTMKKLSDPEIEALNLPLIEGEPNISVLYPARDKGTGQEFFILQRPGAVFKLPSNHAHIQEIQLQAAGDFVNDMQARNPIDRAASIKRAIAQAGFRFQGGPIETLEFGIKALNVILEMEKLQTKLHMIDALQGGISQLRSDLSVGAVGYRLLPPHRRMNVALISQVLMVRAAEEMMTDKTLKTAEDMKAINTNLEAMKKEAREMWVDFMAESTQRAIATGSEGAKKVLGDLTGALINASDESLRTLLRFTLGEEAPDQGAVEALLDKLGSLGNRLRAGANAAGVDVVSFIKSVFRSKDEEGVIDADAEEE